MPGAFSPSLPTALEERAWLRVISWLEEVGFGVAGDDRAGRGVDYFFLVFLDGF